MTTAYLALGSNLGDRAANLEFARRRLGEEGVAIVAVSAEENTAPVGGVEQPDFLNQVLEVETGLSPHQLLATAKRIEREAGREPGEVRWGPRVLDIDILLYGEVVLESEELTLPHPALVDRAFVRRELAQVAPVLVADAVVLVDYDPAWPAAFEAEARRLREGLGPLAVRVDHVGSTAIPGLAAKPIIDIQVSVPDVRDQRAYRPALEGLGYAYLPDDRFPTYPFFRYPAEGERRVHLHAAGAGSAEERDHLEFRDRLRADRAVAELYRALKSDLARRYFADRTTYSNSKGDFVSRVLGTQAASD